MRRGKRLFSIRWIGCAAVGMVFVAALLTGAGATSAGAQIGLLAPNANGTQGNAVVLQPDGSPSIFVEETGGSLFNYWYVNGVWDAAEIVSSGVWSYPTAVLQPDGSPSVFFIGSGGSLWNYSYVNGTWPSTDIATSDVTSIGQSGLYGAPDVIIQGGEPTVFVAGTGNTNVGSNVAGIWEYTESSSGTWSSNEIVAASSNVGLGMGPAIVVTAPNSAGTASLFVNQGGALWEYQAPDWTGSQVIPGGSVEVVTLQPDGYPSIFTQNLQGSGTSTQSLLRNYWYANGAWDTADLSAPYINDLAVTLQPDGSPSVFALGNDALWNTWYANGPWDNAEITTESMSTSYPLSVTVQPDGSPSVFAVDANGGLVNYWYVDGVWDAGTVVPSGVGSPQVPICGGTASETGSVALPC